MQCQQVIFVLFPLYCNGQSLPASYLSSNNYSCILLHSFSSHEMLWYQITVLWTTALIYTILLKIEQYCDA